MRRTAIVSKPPAMKDGRARRDPSDPNKYLMMSADCHANEPGSLWRDRIDAKFRDRLPHVEVDANGEKWFVAEGVGKSRVRARMIGDVPRENSEDRLRGRVGADPKERIQDQLRDGIDAEIIFPNKGLMMFATKDAAFGMAQCRVWNDFAWEMYGEYNDFMSPAAAIMTSDVTLAIEEIKRVAKIGFRFLDAAVQAGLRRPRLARSQLQFDDLRSDVGGDRGLRPADHLPRLDRTRSARGAQGRRRGDQLCLAFAVADYRAGREPVRVRRARAISQDSNLPPSRAASDGCRGRSTRWTRRIASIICGRIRSSSSCRANTSAAMARQRFRKIAPGSSSRRNGTWSTTSCGPMTIRTPKERGRIRRKRSSARWVISSDSARAKILGLNAAKMFKFDVELLIERRRNASASAQH